MELRVARSREVLTRRADPRAELTAVERQRADTFYAQVDADDFVAAHLLVRECVGAITGDARVVIEQCCPTCGGTHGKPAVVGLPETHVSWSHRHGWVAAVAAVEQVGVDLETRERRPDVGRLVRRTATAREAAAIGAAPDEVVAYLQMWCVKESLVKVGVLTIAGFGRADVSSGRYEGFALTTTVTDDYVLGVAVQA